MKLWRLFFRRLWQQTELRDHSHGSLINSVGLSPKQSHTRGEDVQNTQLQGHSRLRRKVSRNFHRSRYSVLKGFPLMFLVVKEKIVSPQGIWNWQNKHAVHSWASQAFDVFIERMEGPDLDCQMWSSLDLLKSLCPQYLDTHSTYHLLGPHFSFHFLKTKQNKKNLSVV